MAKDYEIGAYTLALVNRLGSDKQAADELIRRVYDRLRRQAGRIIANDKAGRDIGITDLVHRTFENVCIGRNRTWASGSQFAAAFIRTMQCVLLDHARRMVRENRRRNPRPDTPRPESIEAVSNLDVSKLFGSKDPQLILDVAEAFRKLSQSDPDCHAIAVRRFYGCQTSPEVAADLGINERTVRRAWSVALVKLGEFLEPMGYGSPCAAAD